MMRSSNWIAVFIAASLFVVGYGLFAPTALPKLWQMRNKESLLRSQIASLNEKVQQQQQQVLLLSGNTKQSREYIEYIARSEHGFIGNDEILLFQDGDVGK